MIAQQKKTKNGTSTAERKLVYRTTKLPMCLTI